MILTSYLSTNWWWLKENHHQKQQCLPLFLINRQDKACSSRRNTNHDNMEEPVRTRKKGRMKSAHLSSTRNRFQHVFQIIWWNEIERGQDQTEEEQKQSMWQAERIIQVTVEAKWHQNGTERESRIILVSQRSHCHGMKNTCYDDDCFYTYVLCVLFDSKLVSLEYPEDGPQTDLHSVTRTNCSVLLPGLLWGTSHELGPSKPKAWVVDVVCKSSSAHSNQ